MNVLMTLLAAAVMGAHAAAAPKGPDIDGKKLFTSKCATCHGADAKGKPAMAKMFKAKPEDLDLTSPDATKDSDAELTKIVTGGKNKMPAFKGKLKDAEIAAVIGYVRTLQKPAAAPEKK